MAREIESWVRHRPPAPRKVGRPEEAERPAPRRARTRVDCLRWAWKESTAALSSALSEDEEDMMRDLDDLMVLRTPLILASRKNGRRVWDIRESVEESLLLIPPLVSRQSSSV